MTKRRSATGDQARHDANARETDVNEPPEGERTAKTAGTDRSAEAPTEGRGKTGPDERREDRASGSSK